MEIPGRIRPFAGCAVLLHLRKIDLADEVLVLNVGGYIGESTGNELAYALALGKPVRTLESLDLEAWRAERRRQMNATAIKNIESTADPSASPAEAGTQRTRSE